MKYLTTEKKRVHSKMECAIESGQKTLELHNISRRTVRMLSQNGCDVGAPTCHGAYCIKLPNRLTHA